MSWSVLQERVCHTKISDVGELKRRIKNEWADLNHAIIERVVGEWQLLYSSALTHFKLMGLLLQTQFDKLSLISGDMATLKKSRLCHEKKKKFDKSTRKLIQK